MFPRKDASTRPFIPTLHRLLANRSDLGSNRHERIEGFARVLEPSSAQRLLEVMDGEAALPRWLIEECSEALGVAADFFAEWRIRETRRFDVGVVGYNTALENLERWTAERSRR